MEHWKIINGKRIWYGEHTHYNQNNQSHKGHKHTEECKRFLAENSRKHQKNKKGYTDENGNRRWLRIGQVVPEGWTQGWPPKLNNPNQSEVTKKQWQNPKIREKMIRGLKYGNSRTNY